LGPDYKIWPTSDHAAKFYGDRPRELGNLALKKRKKRKKKSRNSKTAVKHKTAGTTGAGRPNKARNKQTSKQEAETGYKHSQIKPFSLRLAKPQTPPHTGWAKKNCAKFFLQ